MWLGKHIVKLIFNIVFLFQVMYGSYRSPVASARRQKHGFRSPATPKVEIHSQNFQLFNDNLCFITPQYSAIEVAGISTRLRRHHTAASETKCVSWCRSPDPVPVKLTDMYSLNEVFYRNPTFRPNNAVHVKHLVERLSKKPVTPTLPARQQVDQAINRGRHRSRSASQIDEITQRLSRPTTASECRSLSARNLGRKSAPLQNVEKRASPQYGMCRNYHHSGKGRLQPHESTRNSKGQER